MSYIETTIKFANEIIEKRKPIGLFWFIEESKYVGIDNSTGDAWTEAFDSKEECFSFLKGGEGVSPNIHNKQMMLGILEYLINGK